MFVSCIWDEGEDHQDDPREEVDQGVGVVDWGSLNSKEKIDIDPDLSLPCTS